MMYNSYMQTTNDTQPQPVAILTPDLRSHLIAVLKEAIEEGIHGAHHDYLVELDQLEDGAIIWPDDSIADVLVYFDIDVT